jgi:hypothetical protein
MVTIGKRSGNPIYTTSILIGKFGDRRNLKFLLQMTSKNEKLSFEISLDYRRNASMDGWASASWTAINVGMEEGKFEDYFQIIKPKSSDQHYYIAISPGWQEANPSSNWNVFANLILLDVAEPDGTMLGRVPTNSFEIGNNFGKEVNDLDTSNYMAIVGRTIGIAGGNAVWKYKSATMTSTSSLILLERKSIQYPCDFAFTVSNNSDNVNAYTIYVHIGNKLNSYAVEVSVLEHSKYAKNYGSFNDFIEITNGNVAGEDQTHYIGIKFKEGKNIITPFLSLTNFTLLYLSDNETWVADKWCEEMKVLSHQTGAAKILNCNCDGSEGGTQPPVVASNIKSKVFVKQKFNVSYLNSPICFLDNLELVDEGVHPSDVISYVNVEQKYFFFCCIEKSNYSSATAFAFVFTCYAKRILYKFSPICVPKRGFFSRSSHNRLRSFLSDGYFFERCFNSFIKGGVYIISKFIKKLTNRT